jgi:hypothetical protein
MSKVAFDGKVDDSADTHQSGAVIAVFPTVDGNFRYVAEGEGYGVLQAAADEELIARSANLM